MDRKIKTVIFALLDFISITVAWVLSFAICRISVADGFAETFYLFLIDVAVMYILFFLLGIYYNVWKYAGAGEWGKTVIALAVVTVTNFLFCALNKDTLRPIWAVALSFIFITLTMGTRAVSNLFIRLSTRASRRRRKDYKRVLIIGAGDAGAMLIREMRTSNKINMNPVCLLDDDDKKMGSYINGVKIVGKSSEVIYFSKYYEVDEIIVAIPSANQKVKSKIISECQKTGCKVKTVPGVYQLAEGKVSVSSVKDVSINDLLGREPVNVNLDEIMGYIENKVVLVTGGGGSIGSELCRQIAKHNPRQLIIFDIYENNAYDIQQELLRHVPELNLEVLIGSVRDSVKINDVFEKYKPQIVFHAAAHKHVPLMEHSPNEAVKNNVSGTYKTATAAGRNGAEKFILISTDKAVNPTNIMGATKRICEMIIQTMNKVYRGTNYVAVRFGNVLGSNGSVIPLFRKQIEEGGPVTVTHRDIVRYFMTIPEAVSLVLQAGAYAKGGEIFVLDMGNQVRIYDLALNMIRLSGFEPFRDIDVKITGLRPGEKLYEERLMDEEGLKKTANDMISIGKPLVIDEKNLFAKIEYLYEEAYKETTEMKKLVHELVPTYTIDETDDGQNHTKILKRTAKKSSAKTSAVGRKKSPVKRSAVDKA